MRQRPLGRAAHTFGFLHGGPGLQLQGGGHIHWRTHALDRQNLDLGAQAHGDQVLQQARQARLLACGHGGRLHLHFVGTCLHRAGATTRLTADQALLRQLSQRTAHRDTGHTELAHQSHLAGQTGIKTAFAQLLAQHQINLVVLGQRQVGVHGSYR